MTEITQTYLGNIQENPQLSQRLTTETYLEVYLNQSDRVKGRIHTHTKSGVAVGIIKSRDRSLQEGDVFQTEQGKLLLIHLQAQELLVLDFSKLATDILPSQLVYLGHILGNNHYPIALENNKIFVQLTTDKSVIEQTIKNLNIPGLEFYYATRSREQEIVFSDHIHVN
jgi:urease accessory protein